MNSQFNRCHTSTVTVIRGVNFFARFESDFYVIIKTTAIIFRFVDDKAIAVDVRPDSIASENVRK